MMAKRIFILMLLLMTALCAAACSRRADGMLDGYYTAEMASFDEEGWKEFVTIYVKNNRMVTAKYDAMNESGFIRSWDSKYMREMNAVQSVYPTKYARLFLEGLLMRQDPEEVDCVTGATVSYRRFQRLAAAAIAHARAGDKTTAHVEMADITLVWAER